MDWRDIPPLSTLRAFEAAVRTGSFSAAGRELNVTHAAISQHVRGLEARLAVSLMRRDGQRLVPTEDGEALAEALSEGFGRIIGGVTDLTERGKTKPLRISLTPSFTETWMMPRIGSFWAAHPDVQIEIAPSTARVDLLRDGFDVAIRYGEGNWPGVKSTPLMFSRYVIVGKRGQYAPVVGDDFSTLKGEHWILEHVWPEGRRWLSTNGIDLDQERVTQLGTTSLVLQAVRDGLGITLASKTTAERDIRSGEVDVLYESKIGTGGYHVVTQPGADGPNLRKFLKWLQTEADLYKASAG